MCDYFFGTRGIDFYIFLLVFFGTRTRRDDNLNIKRKLEASLLVLFSSFLITNWKVTERQKRSGRRKVEVRFGERFVE